MHNPKPLSLRDSKAFLIAIQFIVLFLLALAWSTVLTQHAYAYVDPSVMTYTIQALAGVVVALSAVAGVVIRRIRKKLMTTFNIDENANKISEGTIHQIDPDSPQASKEFLEAKERARLIKQESSKTSEVRGIERLSWRKRLVFALLMSIFFTFVVLTGPAIEVYGNNADSLVLPLQEVGWIPFVFNGILAVLMGFALSALKGKRFLIALLVVFCITFASYIQAFFMNHGMMPADGGYIGWHEWYFVRKMICSGIVWLAIILIPLLASREHRMAWLKGTTVVALCVIVMQAAGVASVFAESNETNRIQDGRPYVTQGDLYTVSPDKNVIMFVVDSYDTHTLEELLGQDPHLLDGFTNFTYFPNTLGTMIPTHYALPYFLSADKPEAEEDLNHYRESRYTESTFLETIDDAGYTVGVYTDSAMFNYRNKRERELSRLTVNIHPIKNPPISIWESFIIMDQMALYRQSPWCFKWAFWYYTTDVNNKMIADVPGTNGNDQLYELDDPAFMQHLRTDGLEVSDDHKDGAFRLIHLFGPHFPFTMDENGDRIAFGYGTTEQQALGSLKVLEKYLEQLKLQGVYDEATIIITADHGVWAEQDDPVQNSISPILLVKPSMPNGSPQEPCQISYMPMSHEDIAPTIIQAVGGDPTEFGSGLTVWDINDEDRIRYFDALTSAGDQGRRIVEYEVVGDALDINNWKKTGNEWLGA